MKTPAVSEGFRLLVLVLAALLSAARPGLAAETIVSLEFDDGRATQYQVRDLLRYYGMRGTFYINSARIGFSGYLTLTQLRDLANDGNEIGGHTLDHVDLTTVSEAEVRRQICEDREALLALGFNVTNFAYPYGAHNATVRAIVAECGYETGRVVGGLTCGSCAPVETIPPADRYALRTRESVRDYHTLATLQNWVTSAEQYGGGWVQIVNHMVCENCGDSYSMSYSTLAAFIEWLAPRQASGTVVKTVREALQPAEDTIPPDTIVSCSPRGCSEWSNGPVTVTLAAIDEGSGVAEIRYTTDGIEPGPTRGVSCPGSSCSFTLSASATLKFRAYDLAGNAEPTQTQAIRIDSRPPVTVIQCSPGGCSEPSNGPVTVSLSATDNAAGVAEIRYTTDGSEPGATSGVSCPGASCSFTLSASATVKFRAFDVARNAEATRSQAIQINGSSPPSISSFSPASGPVGTAVIITGSGFSGATRVAFNGVTASFTVASSTQINTTVPAGATTGRISVTTAAGTGQSAGSFTVTQAPSISSFSPASGPVGTAVTITGSRFSGTTAVSFNGTGATFTVVSSSQINATVPSGATTGRISVTTASGTGQSAGSFTVAQPPSISSFSPASGPAGTAVTVTGSGFSGATRVAFNGVTASFTVASSTQISTTVPAGATTGRISVTTASGTGSSAGSFTVTQPPSITSFSPASGPVGTAVTVTGSGFSGATRVAFNGFTASFTVVSSTQISTTVPAGATTGRISVTTAAGTGTSAASFTVTQPPSIYYFSPSSGPVGTAVTITGSGFSGATRVTFNGVQAGFNVMSSTQINTTVPAGATSGKIIVTTGAGTTSGTTDFRVTNPPVITGFTPGIGAVGTPVTITGSRFTGVTQVAFNGKPALSFTVVGSTTIIAVVPLGASSGKISVTTGEGTGYSSAGFTVLLGL